MVRFHPHAQIIFILYAVAEPSVIYEDKNFVALNKPAGLLVHRIPQEKKTHEAKKSPTVADWVLRRYPEIKNVGDDPAIRPGIVHRLDKDTSGIMIIPKNKEYFRYLKSLFQERKIKKTYYALVCGVPKESRGVIAAPIGILSGSLKRSTRAEKMVKDAVTEYKVIRVLKAKGKDEETEKTYSFLEVMPRTGRTHQIRVHLKSIGCPVAGDRLYGPKKQPPEFKRLMLHARSLEFPVSDGKPIKIEADPPEDFQSILALFS